MWFYMAACFSWQLWGISWSFLWVLWHLVCGRLQGIQTRLRIDLTPFPLHQWVPALRIGDPCREPPKRVAHRRKPLLALTSCENTLRNDQRFCVCVSQAVFKQLRVIHKTALRKKNRAANICSEKHDLNIPALLLRQLPPSRVPPAFPVTFGQRRLEEEHWSRPQRLGLPLPIFRYPRTWSFTFHVFQHPAARLPLLCTSLKSLLFLLFFSFWHFSLTCPQRVNRIHVVMETLLGSYITSPVMEWHVESGVSRRWAPLHPVFKNM